MQDAEIEKVFRFRIAGGDTQAPLISIPRWRVRHFTDAQEAYNFSKEFLQSGKVLSHLKKIQTF